MHKNNDNKYKNYHAFKRNWGFLPEPALLIKDYIRSNFVKAFMMASDNDFTRPILSAIVNSHVKKPVISSGKLFIHIPKNSGTSISKILYGQNLPHFTIGFYKKVSPDIVNKVETFAVIRNPIERFASSCKFILSAKTDAMLVDRWTMHRFKGCLKITDFLDKLSREEDLIGSCIPFHRQYSYVNVDEKISVKHLFNMSSKNGLNDIESYLGCKLPIINRTNLKMEITKEDIKRIEKMYADDMEIYEKY